MLNVDINIGSAKLSVTHALIGNVMLVMTIFDRMFIRSNISAMDRLVVVKFHTNIANRRLFRIQRKILAVILHS